MNIGFLYGQRTYPPRMSGSVHGYQLAKGLTERGHRLFSWYYGQDDSPFITHFRRRQILRFLRAVDLLYVRINWNMKGTFRHLRRLRLGRLPVVWELNGLPKELPMSLGRSEEEAREATERLRRMARHVDAAIGVTERIRDYLRDELGIAESYCIPNGSDPELFKPGQPRATRDAPLRVAWIGETKWPWHDLDSLLQAASLLAKRNANVQFTIYGNRENLPDDLPANVTCPGKVPYTDLGNAIGVADVGLFLLRRRGDGTLKEALPLKLFDYMACGLAVVAQDAGQTGEVIREWDCGLFTTGEPEDVAEKILTLERDRERCHRLGKNGRRAVEEYYNWGRVVEETETVLQIALNAQSRQRR